MAFSSRDTVTLSLDCRECMVHMLPGEKLGACLAPRDTSRVGAVLISAHITPGSPMARAGIRSGTLVGWDAQPQTSACTGSVHFTLSHSDGLLPHVSLYAYSYNDSTPFLFF